ncbi:hypothetical protein L6452_34806 [Arctium lappa]|uniref:Uncharacterized protein n=1 Tax=Arctium lappa TaxID=4217 RepID=A0ACB8YJG3_ARCLA|nr:hypothetical protein L6452_34806 [Arctium lappa]
MAHHLMSHVSTPSHFSFAIYYLFFRHKSSPYTVYTHTHQIFLSFQTLLTHPPTPIHPHPLQNLLLTTPVPPYLSLKMVKLGEMGMVKRPNYPSSSSSLVIMWVVLLLLMLISSSVAKTKGSSSTNTQFFKIMRHGMSRDNHVINGGATFNGLLPKAVPIPPSGPSHHHNAVGINTLHP